jgi:peptidylprolyl isomerase
MTQAKHGDAVDVHYTGKLEDGTIIDTSTEDSPLRFTIGEGRFIADFEQAVVGLNPGESKNVKITSEKVYGPYRKELVLAIDRDQFPTDIQPEVGQQLEIHQEDGAGLPVMVTHVSEAVVILDANHPLAGKDLIVDIHLIDIV